MPSNKYATAKNASERRVAWQRIRDLLPRKKTPEEKQRRITLFKQFDVTNRKALTLEETYNGCVDILHLDEFTPRVRDITLRAFNKAKELGTIDRDVGSEDHVEFLEFRMLLCYIYDYFELTVMFDEIDTSGNMMIDEEELRDAVPMLEDWGVKITDPARTFCEIDDNGSGNITFDEFATWAVAKKLDADDDVNNDEHGAIRRPEIVPNPTPAPAQDRSLEKTAAERRVAWQRIRDLLPRKKTLEDKKRRVTLFKQFDVTRRKALTLEETYNGCVDILHLDEFTPRVRDITIRAFNKAKELGTIDRDVGSEDHVEFIEFRMLLCYIYDYFELTVMFDEIDTAGDMMVDEQEFNDAVPMLEDWGVKITDADAAFREIDVNDSGYITFDEFAAWAAEKKLDADDDVNNDEHGAIVRPEFEAAEAPREIPAEAAAPAKKRILKKPSKSKSSKSSKSATPAAAATPLEGQGQPAPRDSIATRSYIPMPEDVRRRRSESRDSRRAASRSRVEANRAEASRGEVGFPDPDISEPVEAEPVEELREVAVPESVSVEEPVEEPAKEPAEVPAEEPVEEAAPALSDSPSELDTPVEEVVAREVEPVAPEVQESAPDQSGAAPVQPEDEGKIYPVEEEPKAPKESRGQSNGDAKPASQGAKKDEAKKDAKKDKEKGKCGCCSVM